MTITVGSTVKIKANVHTKCYRGPYRIAKIDGGYAQFDPPDEIFHLANVLPAACMPLTALEPTMPPVQMAPDGHPDDLRRDPRLGPPRAREVSSLEEKYFIDPATGYKVTPPPDQPPLELRWKEPLDAIRSGIAMPDGTYHFPDVERERTINIIARVLANRKGKGQQFAAELNGGKHGPIYHRFVFRTKALLRELELNNLSVTPSPPTPGTEPEGGFKPKVGDIITLKTEAYREHSRIEPGAPLTVENVSSDGRWFRVVRDAGAYYFETSEIRSIISNSATAP